MSQQTHSQWFKQQRYIWILESLRIFGFINRFHIMTKFDISIAQASLDLRDVLKDSNGKIAYNKSLKHYEMKS